MLNILIFFLTHLNEQIYTYIITLVNLALEEIRIKFAYVSTN